jgi:hypothetical protein
MHMRERDTRTLKMNGYAQEKHDERIHNIRDHEDDVESFRMFSSTAANKRNACIRYCSRAMPIGETCEMRTLLAPGKRGFRNDAKD